MGTKYEAVFCHARNLATCILYGNNVPEIYACGVYYVRYLNLLATSLFGVSNLLEYSLIVSENLKNVKGFL